MPTRYQIRVQAPAGHPVRPYSGGTIVLGGRAILEEGRAQAIVDRLNRNRSGAFFAPINTCESGHFHSVGTPCPVCAR